MTQVSTNKRTALFPGTFNPFTAGHADIARRGLAIFDELIIGVGINASKPKADAEAVLEPIRRLFAGEPRIRVEAYSGLTVDAARQFGATAPLRGVRSAKDYDYERDMADINHQLSGIESVILFSKPELGAISSSVVRELQAYGVDTSAFLPK